MAETGRQSRGRRRGGFRHTGALINGDLRKATAERGFSETRLLTHWADVAGPELSARCRPVEVSYRKGFGATLTLLCSGSDAPIVEMQKPQIVERVNACYGYAAIARVRVTQTAAQGFAEPAADFDHAAAAPAPDGPSTSAARDISATVRDGDLRAALETLGAHVISARRKRKGTPR